MNTYFPPLSLSKETLQNIRIASRLVFENGPGFLEDPECTYTPEIKAFLRGGVCESELGNGVDAALEAPEEEAESLLKFLKRLENSLEDTNDKLAYVRACATLLEKIVSTKEKAMNLKRLKEFEDLVVGTLENFLTPAQRTQFQNSLQQLGGR